MIEIAEPLALREHLGREVAVSEWLLVGQERIDQFAAATGDEQWIHVDAARAGESPFGTTIAHGFLTLSLVSALMKSAVSIGGVRMGINYGLNRVRFPSPVPSGSRVRARFVPLVVDEMDDCTQVTWRATVEREDGGKPCCVAEWVVRYYR